MLIIHFVFRFLCERSKTDRHGITEILLKVALNTVTINGFFKAYEKWKIYKNRKSIPKDENLASKFKTKESSS